jgi:hypothetical protein
VITGFSWSINFIDANISKIEMKCNGRAKINEAGLRSCFVSVTTEVGSGILTFDRLDLAKTKMHEVKF